MSIEHRYLTPQDSPQSQRAIQDFQSVQHLINDSSQNSIAFDQLQQILAQQQSYQTRKEVVLVQAVVFYQKKCNQMQEICGKLRLRIQQLEQMYQPARERVVQLEQSCQFLRLRVQQFQEMQEPMRQRVYQLEDLTDTLREQVWELQEERQEWRISQLQYDQIQKRLGEMHQIIKKYKQELIKFSRQRDAIEIQRNMKNYQVFEAKNIELIKQINTRAQQINTLIQRNQQYRSQIQTLRQKILSLQKQLNSLNNQQQINLMSFSRQRKQQFDLQRQDQFQELIGQLMEQLQSQRNKNKMYVGEINSLRADNAKIIQKSIEKDNKIYSYKIIQNGKKGQESPYKQKINGSITSKLKLQQRLKTPPQHEYKVLELQQGDLSLRGTLNNHQKYHLCSKILDFYLRKAQHQQHQLFRPSQLEICNFIASQPHLASVRVMQPNKIQGIGCSLQDFVLNMTDIISQVIKNTNNKEDQSELLSYVDTLRTNPSLQSAKQMKIYLRQLIAHQK